MGNQIVSNEGGSRKDIRIMFIFWFTDIEKKRNIDFKSKLKEFERKISRKKSRGYKDCIRDNANFTIDELNKLRGTGIYAVGKLPPCNEGETFQALEFVTWNKGRRMYRKSILLEYRGYSPGKENIKATIYASKPGKKDVYFLHEMDETDGIIDYASFYETMKEE